MAHGISSLSTILAVALLAPTFAHGQDQSTRTKPPVADPISNWDDASSRARAGTKLLVITTAQPTRRTTCRVRSIASNQLACKGSFGKVRIYKPQEIAAVILPGDGNLKWRFLVGFNAAAGAAAWGTYVLAPVCLPCAVATGLAAGFFFFANGVVLIADDQPDSLIYLAPNQQLLPDPNGRTIRLKTSPHVDE